MHKGHRGPSSPAPFMPTTPHPVSAVPPRPDLADIAARIDGLREEVLA